MSSGQKPLTVMRPRTEPRLQGWGETKKKKETSKKKKSKAKKDRLNGRVWAGEAHEPPQSEGAKKQKAKR